MEEDKKEMSFLDHLEALRWHLVRSVISIFALSILCFLNSDLIFNKIIFALISPDFITFQWLSNLSEYIGLGELSFSGLASLKNLQELNPGDQFFAHIKISIYSGFILSFPYVIWEMFNFVRPALHTQENRIFTLVMFFSSCLFLMGILFGYYFVSPLSLNFLAGYNIIDAINKEETTFVFSSVIYLVSTICFAMGILFELPVLTYLLSKLGFLTPEFMRSYRRHAIVLILVIAAVITPPDVISQILVAIPVFFLYEVSIMVSKRANKNRKT